MNILTTKLEEKYQDILDLGEGEIQEVIQEGDILEFKLGGIKRGAKYIQRIGSPGRYIYIYPKTSVERMSRKARFSYGKFVGRSKKFLKSIQINYGATSMNVKPKSWNTAIIKLNSNKGTMSMFVNLKKHQIYSYRSHNPGTGTSSNMAKRKRAGLLRYR